MFILGGQPNQTFIPVRLCRLAKGNLSLMHSEETNEWCIWAQDKHGFWASQVFLSKSISWLTWCEVVEHFTRAERENMIKQLADPTLTDPEARSYPIQELYHLEFGYPFTDQEKYEALAKRVSDEEDVQCPVPSR